MAKINKLDALAALKEEMNTNVKKVKRDDVKTSKSKAEEVSKPKNVPWYPATNKLKKELKQLALDEETTMNALLTEGVRYVFEKRGKDFDSYI